MACVFVWGGARSGRVAVPTELWHQKGPRAVGASRGVDAATTPPMESQQRLMTSRRSVVWISHRTRKRFLTPFLLSVIEEQEVIKTILKRLARIIHEEVNIRPPEAWGQSMGSSLLLTHLWRERPTLFVPPGRLTVVFQLLLRSPHHS